MKLFGAHSPPFMSSDVIFLQAKWRKIKQRVEGWKSGKKMWFKRITVCPPSTVYHVGTLFKALKKLYIETGSSVFDAPTLKEVRSPQTVHEIKLTMFGVLQEICVQFFYSSNKITPTVCQRGVRGGQKCMSVG